MTVLPQLERELLRAHDRSDGRRAHGLLRVNAGMIALVASFALTFAIAAVFLLGVHRRPGSTAPARGGDQHGGGNGIDQALIRDFRILRRPVRPSDRLTGVLTQIATPDAPINGNARPARLGLMPKLAREANLPGTGFRAWLIPGRHGLCWAAEYGTQVLGAFCSSFQNPASALTAGDGYASVKTATGLISIGLVTDHVRALELIGPNGQRKPVGISDGFYTMAGVPGKNLSATTATGTQILPRLASDLVLSTAGSRVAAPSTPHQRGTLLAQIDLRSPAGGPAPKGIARIYSSTHGISLSLEVAGLAAQPTPNAYAVWLDSPARAARLLGFITQRPDRGGTVTPGGVLPSDARRYHQILVTLEGRAHPTSPGKTILLATLSLPSAHK